MSAFREGGDRRVAGRVAGPFTEAGVLSVVRCCRLSCSSDVTAGSVAEARFCSSGNFESTYEGIESVSHFSKRSEGPVAVFWISIGRGVREVGERCFSELNSLVGVTLGASCKVERICAEAFGRTSIESLSIPNSVVELGERCFWKCKSLRSVSFGASSKLERICAETFSGTRIESLSIPDSVVELGKECFDDCQSLRNVIFGASSKLERICAYAFYGTNIESLSIPDSVVALM